MQLYGMQLVGSIYTNVVTVYHSYSKKGDYAQYSEYQF